ncbi:MAG: ABC transporter permease [Rhizobiaceae bacterium]|nr:ABC transporter permease [Rhizobiaceae bacterium]
MSTTSSSSAFLTPVRRIKIVTILVILAAWQLLAVSGLLFEGVLPQPLQVLGALYQELLSPSLYYDLGITLFEAALGFIIGSAIAIGVGLWLGSSNFMRRAFEPYIHALAGMPKIIFLPILFLVFGLGIESKIAKSAMSTFFPVVLSTIAGFLQIDKTLINVGRSFDLTRSRMVRMIYIPAMLRPLAVGLQLGVAMSIIGVLSAEIAYASAGLGARLIRYSDNFNISSTYAVMIIIFAVAAFVNYLFARLQEPFLRHERSKAENAARPVVPVEQT